MSLLAIFQSTVSKPADFKHGNLNKADRGISIFLGIQGACPITIACGFSLTTLELVLKPWYVVKQEGLCDPIGVSRLEGKLAAKVSTPSSHLHHNSSSLPLLSPPLTALHMSPEIILPRKDFRRIRTSRDRAPICPVWLMVVH
jgi:hypothetical protein